MQETFLLCNSIAVTQTAIYGAAAVISLLLLIGYFGIARKKTFGLSCCFHLY